MSTTFRLYILVTIFLNRESCVYPGQWELGSYKKVSRGRTGYVTSYNNFDSLWRSEIFLCRFTPSLPAELVEFSVSASVAGAGVVVIVGAVFVVSLLVSDVGCCLCCVASDFGFEVGSGLFGVLSFVRDSETFVCRVVDCFLGERCFSFPRSSSLAFASLLSSSPSSCATSACMLPLRPTLGEEGCDLSREALLALSVLLLSLFVVVEVVLYGDWGSARKLLSFDEGLRLMVGNGADRAGDWLTSDCESLVEVEGDRTATGATFGEFSGGDIFGFVVGVAGALTGNEEVLCEREGRCAVGVDKINLAGVVPRVFDVDEVCEVLSRFVFSCAWPAGC